MNKLNNIEYSMLFFILFLYGNSFSQLANGHVLLNFPQYVQEHDSTCWAANSRDIIQYYSNSAKITAYFPRFLHSTISKLT
jgi:hypothetical protein